MVTPIRSASQAMCFHVVSMCQVDPLRVETRKAGAEPWSLAPPSLGTGRPNASFPNAFHECGMKLHVGSRVSLRLCVLSD